jgi:hypothetical protein
MRRTGRRLFRVGLFALEFEHIAGPELGYTTRDIVCFICINAFVSGQVMSIMSARQTGYRSLPATWAARPMPSPSAHVGDGT